MKTEGVKSVVKAGAAKVSQILHFITGNSPTQKAKGILILWMTDHSEKEIADGLKIPLDVVNAVVGTVNVLKDSLPVMIKKAEIAYKDASK